MNFLHLSTMAEFFGKKEAAKYFFDSIVNLFGKKHEKESPPSRHNLRPRIEKARSEGTPATTAKTPQRQGLPPQP